MSCKKSATNSAQNGLIVGLFIFIGQAFGTTSLRGTVVDPENQAIPNVTIEFHSPSGNTMLHTTQSGPDGSFFISDMVEKIYQVRLSVTGWPDQWFSAWGNTTYRQYTTEINISASLDTLALNIVSSPLDNTSDNTLALTLADSAGDYLSSLSGINVSLIREGDYFVARSGMPLSNPIVMFDTLQCGSYYIAVQSTEYPVQFWSPYGATAQPLEVITVSGGENVSQTIRLLNSPAGSGTLCGACVSATDAPLDGITVSLCTTTDTFRVIYSTTTASDGVFSFSSTIDMPYYLKLSGAGYPAQWYSPEREATTLRPEHSIVPQDSPCSPMSIRLSSAPVDNPAEGFLGFMVYDSSGTNILSSGAVRLIDRNTGVTLSPVYDEAFKAFVIENIPTGEYMVRLAFDPYPVQYWSPGINTVESVYYFCINAGETMTSGISMTMKPQQSATEGYGAVQGVVTGSEGRLQGVSLVLYSSNHTVLKTTQSGVEGAFRFDAIPEGPISLRVEAPPYPIQYWSQGGMTFDWTEANLVYLNSNDVLVINPGLINDTSTGGGTTEGVATVKGKVSVYGSSAAVSRARVVLFDYDPGPINTSFLESPYTAFTQSDGTFSIENVPTGAYRCMAEADSLNYVAQFYPNLDMPPASPAIRIDAVGQVVTIDFLLRKGGTVRGSVVDNNGSPLAGVNISALREVDGRWFSEHTAGDGTFTVAGVPSGVWNLSVNHESWLPTNEDRTRQLTVTEGATMTVSVFRMEQGCFITGEYTTSLSNVTMEKGLNIDAVVALYGTATRQRGELVRPEHIARLELMTGGTNVPSGTFCAGPLPKGSWRMLYMPQLANCRTCMETNTWPDGVVEGPAHSFIDGTSFYSLPVTTVACGDTSKNHTLTLSPGFSVPIIMTDENGTPLTDGCDVEFFVRQDSIYVLTAIATQLPDGQLTAGGLKDDNEYYVYLHATGFPDQFWTPESSTVAPSVPYRLSSSSGEALQLRIVRNPVGNGGFSGSLPINLSIGGDSLGYPLLAWSVDGSFAFDTIKIWRCDRFGNLTGPITRAPLQNGIGGKWRDLSKSGGFRRYIATGRANNATLRSNSVEFDSRTASLTTEPIWLGASSSRHGVMLEWGVREDIALGDADTVLIYRARGSEQAEIIEKRAGRSNVLYDGFWNRSDSNVTFTYRAVVAGRNISSKSVSKKLDAQFFSALAKRLIVGPYEKYTRISDAIAAATNYDHIEVRSGTYRENISLGGKCLSIYGVWEYGKPPVIDGGGRVAITIPFCNTTEDFGSGRICGLKICNSSVGIKSFSDIEMSECLFDNVTIALSTVVDSAAMTDLIAKNPFMESIVKVWINSCTFVAGKAGSTAMSVTATGAAEKEGYNGTFAGIERFVISPAVSLSTQVYVSSSNFVGYHSVGLQSGLPANVQGVTSRIMLQNCNYWKTDATMLPEKILTMGSTSLDPHFIDTLFYFIGDGSPLAGKTRETWINYDSHIKFGEGDKPGSLNGPSIVKDVKARTVGLNAVLVTWRAASATENVRRYRIYRAPGDSTLFYVNEASQWEPRLSSEEMFIVVDSFSTDKTVFLDTTVEQGLPYVYAVAAIDSSGTEGDIYLPASWGFSSFVVNRPQLQIPLAAGKWYMVGSQGTEPIAISTVSRHSVFGWNDLLAADKTFSYYSRPERLEAAKGYWFKPASDTVMTVTQESLSNLGQVESAIGPTLVKGATGWNMISSPFPFDITPDWPSPFTVWEWNSDSAGYRKTATLSPWKAYWVFTDRDTMLSLWKKRPLSYYLSRPLAKKSLAQSAQWHIRLILSDGKSWDTDNFLGVLTPSAANSASCTVHEPPSAFGAVGLCFFETEGKSPPASEAKRLAELFKVDTARQNRFDWMVGIAPSEKPSVITAANMDALPSSLYAFWVEQERIINLRESPQVSIPAHDGEKIGYVVVTSDLRDLALYSGKLLLRTPYPNPFRGSAAIEYVLPCSWSSGETGGGHVSLSLYDINGRKVVNLLSGKAAPGRYRIVWNGENGSGRQVAAGMYVLRLHYGDNVKNVRLFRVR